MDAPPDETCALLRRWHDGDREALAALLEQHREWIEQRVRSRRGDLLRRHAETGDDIQDLMVRVLEYTPRFVTANGRQFRGLVARMIENLLTDKARQLERRKALDRLAESLGSESRLSLDPGIRQATAPDEAAARNEQLAWMRLGLEFLPPEDRDLVTDRQFEGRSFVELAEEEGLQPDAIRMRFHRALLRLAGIVQRLQSGEVAELAEDSSD